MYTPLVSIVIPNYNYGNYLRTCLDSVLNQTYTNIECIIRDNASTDNSWEIIQEYKEKFKKKNIRFHTSRSRKNLGSAINTECCEKECKGELIHYLCSDDWIEPTFIEKAVQTFSLSPNISAVIINRQEITETGETIRCAPFYNESCIVPGEDQACVLMMSGVCVLSQVVYKNSCLKKVKIHKRTFRYIPDWYTLFLMSMVGDIAYLTQPLFNYRVHQNSETTAIIKNLTGIFEEYILINSFVELSTIFDKQKPIEKYDDSIKKIGDISLRFTLTCIKNQDFELAKKYLLLSLIFDSNLEATDRFSILKKAIETKTTSIDAPNIIEKRTISYSPPENYISIDNLIN